jgi:hypothetical protein
MDQVIVTALPGSLMAKKGYSFGTFQGVFVPSILTILGVIMYMRFGWVLGHVGIVSTLLIVTIATSTVKKMRLGAEIIIHENPESLPHWNIITGTSSDAAFSLLGIHGPKAPEHEDEASATQYRNYFDGIIDGLRTLNAAALVMAHEKVDFERLFIE